MCFVDIIKAFDQAKRKEVRKSLKIRGVNENLIECIKSTCSRTLSYVRVRHEKSNMFTCKNGFKQECALILLLFSLMLNEVIKKYKKQLKPYNVGFWKMKKIQIRELCYADDVVTFGSTVENSTTRKCKYNNRIYKRTKSEKNKNNDDRQRQFNTLYKN